MAIDRHDLDTNCHPDELTLMMMTAHHQQVDRVDGNERKILSQPAAASGSVNSPASPNNSANEAAAIRRPLLDKCDGEQSTACLSTLLESSISTIDEDDDSVNSSISSMDDEDEVQETGVIGTAEGVGFPIYDHPRSCSSTLLPESVVNDDTFHNDVLREEVPLDGGDGRSRYASKFLLARIQADSSLFIAALVLGVVCSLWTVGERGGEQRFWFIDAKRRGSSSSSTSRNKRRSIHKGSSKQSYPAFPSMTLLGISGDGIALSNPSMIKPPYSPIDFQYDTMLGRRRTLPYWDELRSAIEQTQYIVNNEEEQHLVTNNSSSRSTINNGNGDDMTGLWNKFSTWGPCYPRSYSSLTSDNAQPSQSSSDDWAQILQTNSDPTANGNRIGYPTYKRTYPSNSPTVEDSLGGLCRPSFLIIGQGKCGTSSLYHYLTGHPRILPAKEKQIDYFRYHESIPISWYYSHFPTIESFLGRGALMTGEASPGYMPYPSVVEAVVKRLSSKWKPSVSLANDGGNDDDGGERGLEAWKAHVRSLPKIIAIVRNPIERAKSSYKYNYVEPAIKKLRAGYGITISGNRIPGKQTDAYYRTNHLFSFEELAFAELDVLKECLKPGGRGESWTYTDFGKESDTFFYESIQRRNNHTSAAFSSDIPPLIHLDEACYADAKSKSMIGVQWKQLAVRHPTKFLALPNWPLIQRLIGRGVYALPLEWWYEVFSHAAAEEVKRIHVVCTEDLSETPGTSMNDVTKFLGLPEFDFTNVTNVGRYNVGGHRGYDTITKSSQKVVDENKFSPVQFGFPRRHQQESSTSSVKEDVDALLAVSNELMNELVHFYHPYNERLFHLIGKRCPW